MSKLGERLRTPLVTIVKFTSCKCESIPDLEEHVSFEQTIVELSASIATAISYVWGEFDRRPRLLGHSTGRPDKQLSFSLGAEWNTDSFVHRLVELTRIHTALWIDQVCLPQNVSEEEWAEVLMAIPLVFKTLQVIALFPGRLCQCLSTAYESYKAAADVSQQIDASEIDESAKAVEDAYERLRDVILGIQCLYANGWNSWVDRIWPSEELRYSREISVCWVETGFERCQHPGDPALDTTQLKSLPYLLYSQEKSRGRNHEDIIKDIRQRGSRWTQAIYLAIGEDLQRYTNMPYTGTHSLEQRKSEDMARFLLGEELRIGSDSDDLTSLFRFVWACEILARTSRSATKSHDYIFSVWADWPSYTIPAPFSHLSCLELMADALTKFFADSAQVFVPSSSPTGLLADHLDGTSWQYTPELCSTSAIVKDTRDVYRPFFWLSSSPTIKHGSGVAERRVLPLRLSTSTSPSSKPQLVKNWLSGRPPDEVLQSILKFKQYMDLGFIIEVARDGIGHPVYDPYTLMGRCDLDTDAIFEFVCWALHLDAVKCKMQGLEAVCVDRKITTRGWRIEETDITCLGLARAMKLEEAQKDGRRSVSIAIFNEEWPLYEAVVTQDRDDKFELFSIAAVWIPLGSVCDAKSDYYIDYEDVTAVLG